MGSDRMQWWREARFGMMVHWGLYSVLGGEWKGRRMDYIGEWIMSRMRIPNAEYGKLAARFDPTAFDAARWVDCARRAGMRYMIVTAKHHDGFALYRSRVDPYNIVDATPFGRDPLAELAEACRRGGVRLCLYYSQSLDWHERGGGGFDAGYGNFGMSWSNDWDFPGATRAEFDEYFRRKAVPQVEELLTNYGPLGAIWFDVPLTLSAAQSRGLHDLVRRLQPDCIMNSRLGNGMGDYNSLGDNELSGRALRGDWETVATLNDTWGYKHFDVNWKSTREVLESLAGSVSRNVNYVLNVGPTGEGAFPDGCLKVLDELGEWMDGNGESIHGTLPTPFLSDPPWAFVTHRPGRVYLHVREWPQACVLRGLRNEVTGARLLSRPDAGLDVRRETDPATGMRTLTVEGARGTGPLPVIALDIQGAVEADNRIFEQPDGTVILPACAAEIRGVTVSAPGAGGQAREPDGRVREDGSAVAVSPAGVVTGWRDTGTFLQWELITLRAGRFMVEIVSSALHHSRPWTGGHAVRVDMGAASLAGTLLKDRDVEDAASRYYPRAVSVLGEIVLGAGGPATLVLRASRIEPNDGVGLAVTSVVLRRRG